MEHNIKFNHEERGSLTKALGISTGLKNINDKIIEASKLTINYKKGHFSKSMLAENLVNLLDLEELLFIAVEAVHDRIKQVSDISKIGPNQVVIKDDRDEED